MIDFKGVQIFHSSWTQGSKYLDWGFKYYIIFGLGVQMLYDIWTGGPNIIEYKYQGGGSTFFVTGQTDVESLVYEQVVDSIHLCLMYKIINKGLTDP